MSAAARMFSTREAAELAGANVRNVDYWTTLGLASATVPAAGTGTDRRYSYDDLIVLAALQAVSGDTNIPTRRQIADALRAADLHHLEIFQLALSPILTVFISLARIRQSLEERLSE